MLYIEKDGLGEGTYPILSKDSYYIKDSNVERKYRVVPGSVILEQLKEDEEAGRDFRYINAVDARNFVFNRYNKPNTGITAVIYKDKLVRNDFDIMSCETIYADKGVTVLGLTLAGYYLPMVFEKHKDSLGYSIDVHFCRQHENFVSVTSKVSVHFENIHTKGKDISLELLFKYDVESGVKDRKFGSVRFTPDGIFLAGDYHALYERDAMKEYMTIEAWKN